MDEFYVELLEMFCDEQGNGSKDGVVLNVNKSLYGIIKD